MHPPRKVILPILNESSLIYLLAAITVLYAIFQLYTFRVNGDIAWLCHEVQVILEGGVLYKDIVENNPPLILLIYYPIVAISGIFGIAPGNLVQYFSLLASLISALVSAYLIKQNENLSQSHRSAFLLFLATLLLMPNADGDFGQREHLLVIFTLPYIISSLPFSAQLSRTKSVAIGIAAGLGFCLKPYFMIIFAAVILCRNLLRGQKFYLLKVEDVAVITLGVLYVIVTTIFFPEYWEILPFISKTYPYYFFIPDLTIARLAYPLYAIVIVAYLSKPLENRQLKFFLGILVASTVEAVIQFKPWSYITLPAFSYATIMAGLSALILKQTKASLITQSVILCLLFFSLPLEKHDMKEVYEKQDKLKSELLILKNAGAKNIHIFSESFGYNFPTVFDAGLTWSSRYAHEWMFRGIYGEAKSNPEFKPIPGMEDYSKKIYEDFSKDFDHYPPDIIAFDTTENSPDFPFRYDYKSWMEKDKKLSSVLKKYNFYTTLDLCDPSQKMFVAICRFDFYVRQGISTPSKPL